jgi:hypothetical protein
MAAVDALTVLLAVMGITVRRTAIKKTPAGELAGEKRWKESSAASLNEKVFWRSWLT